MVREASLEYSNQALHYEAATVLYMRQVLWRAMITADLIKPQAQEPTPSPALTSISGRSEYYLVRWLDEFYP